MPTNLVAQTLRGGLFTRIVGRQVRYFGQLPSTMDEAARLAQAGAPEGTVVVAETQTASRGRLGRVWVSQPGNLYLSVVFRPSLATLPLLSSLGAVAVVRAIRAVGGVNPGLTPRLKWPNDVLLDVKKVAGILVESAIQGEQVSYAVLGIGINVSLEVEEISPDPPKSRLPAPSTGSGLRLYERGEGTTPPDPSPCQGEGPAAPSPVPRGKAGMGGLLPHATSLNAVAGREVARDALLRSLLEELDRLHLELGQEGGKVMAQWRELLDTLGQRVSVIAAGQRLEGLAEDVDDLGNLLLRQDDGQVVTVTAGDVTLSGQDFPHASPLPRRGLPQKCHSEESR
ncbi:MAG: biotin--[acetyl-CoA-carboxylase] ligase [SAR202 cluster bacterium]|nr:biotin--[acetyl-CoA-carboxylase] ligase [SAR202 cluster bacterium]